MRRWIALLGAFSLAACTAGPDYRRPDLALPAQWNSEVLLSAQERENLAEWWTYFGDPVLQALVRQAVARNLNIRLEIARVREARARLGFAHANQFPTTALQVDAARQQGATGIGGFGGSDAGLGAGFGDLGSDGGGFGGDDIGAFNFFSIAGVLNYEVDLWGRLDRIEESARAALFASIFARDAVALMVITDVVTTYFRLLGAERQLVIALRTVRSRERNFELERARYINGATDQLTFRQSQAELERVRAQVPPLREQVRDLESALSVLIGESAREIMQERRMPRGSLLALNLPTVMPDLLPSALIERRPDIRAAEAALIAANANVGAVKAVYFPRLNLSGLIGLEALKIDDLFGSSADNWSIGSSLLTPLLYFGRIRADVERARAIRRQAEVQYRRTVQTAFQEVRNALTSLQIANERLEARLRQIKALQRTLALARIRYRAGYSSFIEVLDAQRQLFNAELAATQAGRDRYIATATLFKALGGGWRAEEVEESAGDYTVHETSEKTAS
jgi:multidrug efflux system outer membrane protein